MVGERCVIRAPHYISYICCKGGNCHDYDHVIQHLLFVQLPASSCYPSISWTEIPLLLSSRERVKETVATRADHVPRRPGRQKQGSGIHRQKVPDWLKKPPLRFAYARSVLDHGKSFQLFYLPMNAPMHVWKLQDADGNKMKESKLNASARETSSAEY